jgi:hypothetical protein
MRWVMAIEDPASHTREADATGRVHAYDIIEGRLAHPMVSRYTVEEGRMWTDAAPGPRCQHCLQIVDQDRPTG